MAQDMLDAVEDIDTTARTDEARGWRRWTDRDVRHSRRDGRGESPTAPAMPATPVVEPVDIASNDPLLAYLQSSPEPVLVSQMKMDSPGVRALRDAGVVLVVPLVTQGELIALLQLGERRSEQEYSADDRRLLENLASQAAPALRVAQLVREQEAEVRRRERYEQEMRVAQLIQQNFLPKQLPDLPSWQVDAHYRPAREVGGDFYDFVDLPDGRLAVVVGDVTDKGVPAALVMASTRSVLRSSAQRLIEPGAVLERVNEMITQDMPPNMFVTCLYGVLDTATGRFRFANAGHNLPCLQTEEGAVEIRATGMPLGLLPGMKYEENELVVEPGRSLLLYSDAIPEAHDTNGDMFSFPRLVEVVGTSSGDVVGTVMAELERFTGPEWEQEDDITLVSLTRSADAPASPMDAATDDDLGEALAAFSVPSEPGNERQVMDRVTELVAGLPIGPDRLDRLRTAVSEATMNAIEHGNQNRSELFVEIRVFTSAHAVVVRITDQGAGGPTPDNVDEPDLAAKLRGDQTPRGWGLFLIRNMVDDLRVHEDVDHHSVDLIVRLDGGGDE